MSESPAQFELVEFEQIEAAPGTALLRVSVRPPKAGGNGPLTLVIHDDHGEHRHQQLPALPGPPGLIRAAFSAPMDQVASSRLFALELPDCSTVRLPVPSQRRSAFANGSDASHADADAGGGSAAGRQARAKGIQTSRLAEAERRAEARRLAITELERRLQVERERRHSMEADVGRLRADREQALAERDEALADRDAALADREQAEARALVAAASAGTLAAQIRTRSDEAELAGEMLQAQLVEKVGEIERVRAAAELAQARAHASRREVVELDEQLAHAQAQITVLEEALSQRSGGGSRIEAADAELELARAEIETLQQRVSQQEAALAELDYVLSKRAAEVELLRLSIDQKAERAAADAAARVGQQLTLSLEAAATQGDELLAASATIELLRIQAEQDRELLAQARAELEARRREISQRDRLSEERDQLEAQAEALFSRLADELARADVEQDLLRHLS